MGALFGHEVAAIPPLGSCDVGVSDHAVAERGGNVLCSNFSVAVLVHVVKCRRAEHASSPFQQAQVSCTTACVIASTSTFASSDASSPACTCAHVSISGNGDACACATTTSSTTSTSTTPSTSTAASTPTADAADHWQAKRTAAKDRLLVGLRQVSCCAG